MSDKERRNYAWASKILMSTGGRDKYKELTGKTSDDWCGANR